MNKYYSTTQVNVRQTPSIKGKVVAVTRNGEEVVHKGTPFVQADKHVWFHITLRSGISGWSVMKFYRLIPETEPNPTGNPIGFHILGNISDEELNRAVLEKSRVYKYIQLDAGRARSVMDKLPDSVHIYRKWIAESPEVYIAKHGGIENAVNAWIESHSQEISLLRGAYFESFNEVALDTLYVEFEARRVQKLSDIGVKSCIINAAAGTTHGNDGNNENFWRKAAPAVQAILNTGGLIGLHAYGLGLMSSAYSTSGWTREGQWRGEVFPSPLPFPFVGQSYPEAWHALAIERDVKALQSPGMGNAKIALTEFGLDDMGNPDAGSYYPAGGKVRGWKTCDHVWRNNQWAPPLTANQFYRQQLDWAGAVLKRIPNFVGAAVFTYGTGGDSTWDQFDVRELYK